MVYETAQYYTSRSSKEFGGNLKRIIEIVQEA
jgi:hypothetical protein